jgi:hypothetical protein
VKDKGYHDQQVVTKYIAWDMREEFNKQQQEQQENVDRQQGNEQLHYVEQQQGIEQQQG